MVKQGLTTVHKDCSLYILNLQLDNGGGCNHTCWVASRGGSLTTLLRERGDGSVTKDQSQWGFTVEQGVTTIHEVVMEAVTHSLSWLALHGDDSVTLTR